MGLNQLETMIDGWYKKLPFKLPEDARKSVAGAFWWLALITGVLQLWAAWSLWRLVDATRVIDYLRDYYGIQGEEAGFFFYLAVVVAVFDGVLLLLAAPALKAWKKIGWNLVFYSLLLNVVYGFVRMFAEIGGGFGAFLWSLLLSTVFGFFIFQVRDYFKKAGSVDLADLTADAKRRK